MNRRRFCLQKLLNCMMDINDLLFTIHDITVAVGKQKMHEAAGPDGIQMEAFFYGCHRLYVGLYLSVLFNVFAKHGYIPSDFCRAVLLPLVKNKNGNLADVNNYRAIAISNAITKLLEDALMKHLVSVNEADDYQSGFKKFF